MILDINNLINSDFNMLTRLGWLLYSRENQDGGLTKEELNELLHIITVKAVESIYKDGYDEGLNDGVEL